MNALAPIELTIDDKDALYRAYMPFVRNGGLFVPTRRRYELGDDVAVVLNLFGSNEPLPITGKVVWVTPERAQGKRAAGIGVQFSLDAEPQTQMEKRLAGMLGGDDPTHTL